MLLKERLRELRKEKKETQVQVAEAIGIVEQHYQKFEGGVNLPNLENAWKLADHFGVTIDYLVGRSDKRGEHEMGRRRGGLGDLCSRRGLVRRDAPPILFLVAPKRECAAPGGREKALRRGGLRQRRPPAAGGGWLALPCRSQGRKRTALGESLGPGRFRDTPASLSAAAHASAENQPARSDAERAKREAGQMRSCTPTTSAPSATGRQLGEPQKT